MTVLGRLLRVLLWVFHGCYRAVIGGTTRGVTWGVTRGIFRGVTEMSPACYWGCYSGLSSGSYRGVTRGVARGVTRGVLRGVTGVLGRVQQWSQPSKTPNVAKRGSVWPTGHWWLGRAPKLGCDGPKIALPHIF